VIEDVIQEENKVVVRSHITATQTEPFMGFPATGRSLSI
jgi:predicted ester cyclase